MFSFDRRLKLSATNCGLRIVELELLIAQRCIFGAVLKLHVKTSWSLPYYGSPMKVFGDVLYSCSCGYVGGNVNDGFKNISFRIEVFERKLFVSFAPTYMLPMWPFGKRLCNPCVSIYCNDH